MWSKEVPRSNKRKLRVTSTSDNDVVVNTHNIILEKIPDRNKKVAEINNYSNHDVEEDV